MRYLYPAEGFFGPKADIGLSLVQGCYDVRSRREADKEKPCNYSRCLLLQLRGVDRCRDLPGKRFDPLDRQAFLRTLDLNDQIRDEPMRLRIYHLGYEVDK